MNFYLLCAGSSCKTTMTLLRQWHCKNERTLMLVSAENETGLTPLASFRQTSGESTMNSTQFHLWIFSETSPEQLLVSLNAYGYYQLNNLSVHGSGKNQALKLSFKLQAQQLDKLNTVLQQSELDTVLFPAPTTPIRLACFDMDSTLIETEVIDELADAAGQGAEVRTITELAMRGELDFKQSLQQRLACVKGLDKQVLEKIAADLPLSPGVERLFQGLSRLGVKTAILSGGFDYFARVLQSRLAIDTIFANQLEIRNNSLTGHYIAPLVDAQFKRQQLIKLRTELQSETPITTLAVGDGANDIAMLNEADIGIAYRAKPLVQSAVGNALNHSPLHSLLHIIEDSLVTP